MGSKLVAIALFLICLVDTASAQSNAVKLDILIGKITTLIRADRAAEALPYFEEYERSGGELSESFFYHQIRALDAAGKVSEVVKRGEVYLNRFGRTSEFYAAVVDIVSRRSIENDLEKAKQAEQARLAEQRAREAEADQVRQQEDDEAAFVRCARDFSSLDTDIRSFNATNESARNAELAGQDVRSAAAALNREKRRLDKAIESTKARCRPVVSKVSSDFKRRVCSHPAYQSAWCSD